MRSRARGMMTVVRMHSSAGAARQGHASAPLTRSKARCRCRMATDFRTEPNAPIAPRVQTSGTISSDAVACQGTEDLPARRILTNAPASPARTEAHAQSRGFHLLLLIFFIVLASLDGMVKSASTTPTSVCHSHAAATAPATTHPPTLSWSSTRTAAPAVVAGPMRIARRM